MPHDNFAFHLTCASAFLRGARAAHEHIEKAREADPAAWVKFIQRFDDARGHYLPQLAEQCDQLADECEVIATAARYAGAVAQINEAAE